MLQIKNGTAYLSDCLEVMKLIPDGSIDCVITDPPYGMDFQSNYRKERYEKIENDNQLDWIDEFVGLIHSKMKDNTHGYVFCSFHNVDIFKQAIEKKFKLKNILIWEKNNTSMGDLKGDYAPKYEMVLYFHKGRREMLGGFRHPNIVKFSRTGNVFHPTEKPVDLIEFLLKNSTLENETVLDCFGGSFTTAVACENTDRKWICIEKDEKYFQVGTDRVKNHNPA